MGISKFIALKGVVAAGTRASDGPPPPEVKGRTLGIWKFIALKALPALVGVALLVVWFMLLRPASLGGPASYVIVAGRSMEPTLRMHDLAIVRARDSYRVGDVIAFRVDEGEVIHRIVGGDATNGFITQGDNNPSPDLWRPRPAQIEGAVWVHVPAGGRAIEFLRQPVNAAIVVGSLTALWLVLPGRRTLLSVASCQSPARPPARRCCRACCELRPACS